jgi:hypothetical protein
MSDLEDRIDELASPSGAYVGGGGVDGFHGDGTF